MIITTDAFVLRSYLLRETSLIVSVLTRDCGKIKAVCKGVRQLKSKQCSHFDPPVLLTISVYDKPNRELQLISDSTIVQYYQGLRSDMACYLHSLYILELIDLLVPVHLSHDIVFKALEAYLHFLAPACVHVFTLAFELKLLRLLGLLPLFDSCLQCKSAVQEPMGLSLEHGGLVCVNGVCDRGMKVHLLRDDVRIFCQTLIRETFPYLRREKYEPSLIEDGIRTVRTYIEYITYGRIKSLAVLAEMFDGSPVLRKRTQDNENKNHKKNLHEFK